MKKIAALVLAGLIATPLYAHQTITMLTQKVASGQTADSWKLTPEANSYGYMNYTSDYQKILITVNKQSDGHKADKVALTCNGRISYLTPGEEEECILSTNESAYWTIMPGDYSHGANGSYTVKMQG